MKPRWLPWVERIQTFNEGRQDDKVKNRFSIKPRWPPWVKSIQTFSVRGQDIKVRV